MRCPKCEEGEILNIFIKGGERMAFLCEFCGTVWLGDEDVNAHSGHSILTLEKDGNIEYTIVDIPGKDENTKPVLFPKYK